MVEWAPRECNREADLLANSDTALFDPAKRMKVSGKSFSWCILPEALEASREAERAFQRMALILSGIRITLAVLGNGMAYLGVVWFVKTTPQMTRFRDAKVCNNWLQIRIDDHRIQSDYKYKSELQNPEGKKSVLGITSAW